MTFRQTRTVSLAQTDAAGVLYFAAQFTLVHDVYESWLASLGFPLREMLAARDWALPIVHAETRYLAPLRIGDEVEIAIAVERVGPRSFTLRHRLHVGGQQVGEGTTAHACIDVASGQARALPPPLAEALRAAARQVDPEGSPTGGNPQS